MMRVLGLVTLAALAACSSPFARGFDPQDAATDARAAAARDGNDSGADAALDADDGAASVGISVSCAALEPDGALVEEPCFGDDDDGGDDGDALR